MRRLTIRVLYDLLTATDPSVITMVSGSAARTAGNKTRSPALRDGDFCLFKPNGPAIPQHHYQVISAKLHPFEQRFSSANFSTALS